MSTGDWASLFKLSRGGCPLLWNFARSADDQFLFYCVESQQLLSGKAAHIDLRKQTISDSELGIMSKLIPLNAAYLRSVDMRCSTHPIF